MKLHIGGRVRAEGWKTLDIEAGPEVDYVGNCTDFSRFDADSVDAIYASHVLEHLSYQNELLQALNEWHRVLKPGAPVMISVPDLQILCHIFADPGLSNQERYDVMRMMFGGQLDAHDFHRVGLFWAYLGSLLTDVGFADIRRVADLGVFEDSSRWMYGNVPISLNVTAVKPA